MNQAKKKHWLPWSILSAVLFYFSVKGFQSNPDTYLWPFVALMVAVFVLGHASRIHKDNKEVEV